MSNEDVTKIEVSESSLSPQGCADLSFISGEGLKSLASFSCERCGKDLKPDCRNWRCEYVRQARAFCERFQ